MKNLFLLCTLTFLATPALAMMHDDHDDAMPNSMHHETSDHADHAVMPTAMPHEAAQPAHHESHTDTHEQEEAATIHLSEERPTQTLTEMDFMHHQNEAGTMSESDQAYTHINHTMHEAMSIDFTGDPDIDFLKGMIPHHQGAVDMAKVQLEYGQDGTLKRFTQRVIREQAREIRFMKINLETLQLERGAQPYADPQAIKAYEIVNENMHREMNMALSGQADKDFVKGMIPHHEGAVAMAKVVLEYGTDPNARRLAYDIINAQESEIYWMKNWLARQRLMQAR